MFNYIIINLKFKTMREKFTQNRRGLLFALTLMIFALVGGKAYAQANSDKVSSLVMTNGTESVNLLAGNPIEKLIADYQLKAEIADANVGYLKCQFGELGDNYVKTWYGQPKGEDGKFTYEITMDYALNNGVTYPVTFTGWASEADSHYGDPIFEETVYVSGATATYEYSPVTITYPETLLYNQNEANFNLKNSKCNGIYFKFSDAVEIEKAFVVLGMGETQDCAVTMLEDETMAVITIPSYVLTSYTNFTVSILAKDKNGNVVKGNNGEGDGSYISVYVDAKFNLPEVTMVDPAPGATVEKISTIKFGYDKGISENSGKITILDKARNVVATSTSMSQVIPEEEADNWDYVPVEIEVIFDNEITANGVYTVVVPEGVFNVDLQSQGFEMKSNREAIFNITVDNGDTPSQAMHVSANPQEGEVGSLKDFEFTFMDYNTCAWTYDAMPYISDGDGNKLATISNVDYGTGWNQVVCSLNAEITEPGTYILTIPAGAVTYDDDPANLNSEVTFTYTIAEADNEKYTVTPAVGTVTSLKTIDVIFDSHSEISFGSGNPSLTDAAGNTYTVNEDFGPDWDILNWARFTIAEEITADGTYTLTLPAGHINYEDGSSNVKDIKFTWTIGSATFISNALANGNPIDVYDVNGTLVKAGADAAALKALATNKVYVINGKKVILK